MRYAILLITLGVLLVMAGLQAGVWGPVLFWLALDFSFLGIAHARGWHRLFDKRSDGTLPFWSWILYLPLLIYTASIWHLIRLLSRESRADQLTEQIYLGRRLLPGELQQEVSQYIDLTSEFQEPGEFRKSPGYLAFPILDASAPSPDELAEVISRVRSVPVFIHCAQGHGRTGLFALALLLSRGEVRTIEEGLALLAKARPGIRLNKLQMRCIESFADARESSIPEIQGEDRLPSS